MAATPPRYEVYRPHPWHGLSVGRQPPFFLNAYVEITPFDGVKYEVDKESGYMMVDRPQLTASLPPCLYGFVPRTYCGDRVRDLAPGSERGDGDPLDICILSERPISRGDLLLRVRVLGGISLVDKKEADDKLVAVLEKDAFWGQATGIDEIPRALVDRLCHYFATYKMGPDLQSVVEVREIYGQAHAAKVIVAAMADYQEGWGG